jgi:DNA-binding transcriptional LysR family regulator
LHEESYVFVAAPARLKEVPLARPTDAAAHILLDLRDDLPLFRYFRDVRPAKESWRFRSVLKLGTIAAVRARLLDGAGVAVLPRYFVAPDLKAGRLRALFPRTKLLTDWFRLAWLEGHPNDTALEALAGELAAEPLR